MGRVVESVGEEVKYTIAFHSAGFPAAQVSFTTEARLSSAAVSDRQNSIGSAIVGECASVSLCLRGEIHLESFAL